MQDVLVQPVDANSPRNSPVAPSGSQAETVGPWTTLLVIAMFVALGHGGSITTGRYLDDYAHYQHLREGNGSYRSAVESSRLGIVGEVLDLWGRQEAGLKFYRPIAFWVMRAEYTAVGWHPLPMHLLSISWHLGCSLLVAAIATRCLGRRFWGLVAGVLMAIHPSHVRTAYWIACQTELMTTFLLLVGILAYSKYAGWPTPWFGGGEAGGVGGGRWAQGGKRENAGEPARPRAGGLTNQCRLNFVPRTPRPASRQPPPALYLTHGRDNRHPRLR